MNFEEFLAFNRNKLLGYFLLKGWFPDKLCIETPYPPSVLSEEKIEQLMDCFRACMPRDSMMLDLWDWDIHFEDDLGIDWLYEAVFGDQASLDTSAEQLAEFFLEKVDEYDMDYNQTQSDEDFDFAAWVREEALTFIKHWREN
jgi:hypothetical protein